MDKDNIIYLDVKTVPAFDFETRMPHTAYTVYNKQTKTYTHASAWTLRDAVQLFRKIHNIREDIVIHLKRPFRPQHTKM